MRKRNFILLAGDYQQIKKDYPSIYTSLQEYFVFRAVFDHYGHLTSYEFVLRYRAMQPPILRRFYLLIDNIHYEACVLYSKHRYFDYMVFFTLVQNLIRIL